MKKLPKFYRVAAVAVAEVVAVAAARAQIAVMMNHAKPNTHTAVADVAAKLGFDY
jgi:hypothetical protein